SISTAMPRFSNSPATSSIERTTPLICGCQASVTIRTLRGVGIGCSLLVPPWVAALPPKAKGRIAPALGKILQIPRLALGELERTAGLGLAVLLALDHAAVTGEEPTLLQHGAQFR